LARGYFALQALAVVGWWLALFIRPAWRAAFRAEAAPDITLLALAPGDLLMLGVGSAFVAWSGPHLLRPRRALAWLVAGATIYGALYTVALTLSGAVSVIGALLMCPAAVACVLAAFALDDQVSSVPPSGAR
jgi:hypothetical protein